MNAAGMFIKLFHIFFENEKVIADINYCGVLAMDLPNGLKKGDEIHLKGRSEFQFKEGKFLMIADYS